MPLANVEGESAAPALFDHVPPNPYGCDDEISATPSIPVGFARSASVTALSQKFARAAEVVVEAARDRTVHVLLDLEARELERVGRVRRDAGALGVRAQRAEATRADELTDDRRGADRVELEELPVDRDDVGVEGPRALGRTLEDLVALREVRRVRGGLRQLTCDDAGHGV